MFECVHEIPPLCKPTILSESLIKPLLELEWILGITDKMKSVRLVQIFCPAKETNRTHSKGYVEDLSTQAGRKQMHQDGSAEFISGSFIRAFYIHRWL